RAPWRWWWFLRAACRRNAARILIVGDVARRGAAAPHRAVGRVGARVGARPAWGGGAGAGVPRGIPRRQTGCRTVGDPHRARRGGAHDAGLLRAPGPEHHPRRVVYVAA